MYCRDIYKLKASKPIMIKSRDEVCVNLELEKIRPCYHTRLAGRVFCRSMPIKDATVLVLDNCFNPLFHTVTDRRGWFNFCNLLSPGIYYAVVAAAGFKMSIPKLIRIRENVVSYLTFFLRKNYADINGFIYGRIYEAQSGKPVGNAAIELESLAGGCMRVYKEVSNRCGQFLICNIFPGRYRLTVSKQGYKQFCVAELSVDRNDRFVLEIILNKLKAFDIGGI